MEMKFEPYDKVVISESNGLRLKNGEHLPSGSVAIVIGRDRAYLEYDYSANCRFSWLVKFLDEDVFGHNGGGSELDHNTDPLEGEDCWYFPEHMLTKVT